MPPRKPRTREEAREYMQQARDANEPCVYGHLGCAAWDGGPCSDEVYGQFDLHTDDQEED